MTINTSDLDFSAIKTKLKSQLRNSGEFEDYDFETSGLSNILDVLAYNTHINALTANMSINESFLSTSQIRASVVGHADTLGYTPKSRTAARATVNVTITDSNLSTNTFTLPRGAEFVSSIDDVIYTFFTTEDYTVQSATGVFEFLNIPIVEGRMKERTFFANSSPEISYIIPDEKIDTSTLSVEVKENGTSLTSEVYQDLNTVTTIDEDSRVYMVGETPSGYYELFFSDGTVLGKRPVQGNVIKISYVSTNHSAGNGAQSFTLNEFFGVGIRSQIVKVSNSAGGSDRESLDSIKLNAPRSYTTQNRLVTADDYTSLIMAKYSNYLRDVIAWGGNDNVPPEYGKVFVSLNFQEGVDDAVIQNEKTRIKQELADNLSIMSIDLEFVDPELTHLEIDTVFNVDSLKSNKALTLEADVQSLINAHIETELSNFNSTFRRSNLLAQIDNLSPAILNSRMTVKVQQRIPVTEIFTETGLTDKVEKDFHVNFPVFLAEPDNDDHIITSSVFKSNGQNVIIKNKLGSTKLQLLDMDNIVKIDNIGSYEPARGTVTLNALTVDENSYVDDVIKISATPANQSTIVPLRNYILTLDSGLSTTRANLDTGAIKVEL